LILEIERHKLQGEVGLLNTSISSPYSRTIIYLLFLNFTESSLGARAEYDNLKNKKKTAKTLLTAL